MKKQTNNVVLFVCFLFLNQGIVVIYNLPLFFKNIIVIHVFLFAIHYLSGKIRTINTTKNKTSIVQFLAINIIRILACFTFLYPRIFNTNEPEYIYIYNFLIIYFVYLFFEIFLEHKKKNA